MRADRLLVVAIFTVGCGAPPTPTPNTAPTGKVVLRAEGTVGTQEISIRVAGSRLRFVFTATNDEGAAALVRVSRREEPDAPPRRVQGTFRPGTPLVREIKVRSGEYDLKIETTGGYRILVEEPTDVAGGPD